MYQEILGMPIVDSYADFEGEVPRMPYWHRVSIGPNNHAYYLICSKYKEAYDAGSPIATVTVSEGEERSPTHVKLYNHWSLRSWNLFAELKDKSERTARTLQYVWNKKVMRAVEGSLYRADNRVFIHRPCGYEDIVSLSSDATCATVKLAGGWLTFSMEKPKKDARYRRDFVPVCTMILRMGKRLRVLVDHEMFGNSYLSLATDYRDCLGGPSKLYLTEKQTRGMSDNEILDLARSMVLMNGVA